MRHLLNCCMMRNYQRNDRSIMLFKNKRHTFNNQHNNFLKIRRMAKNLSVEEIINLAPN